MPAGLYQHAALHSKRLYVRTRTLVSRFYVRLLSHRFSRLYSRTACRRAALLNLSHIQPYHPNKLPEVFHNKVLSCSYPVCSEPSYSEIAEREVDRRQAEVDTDGSPTVSP